MKLTGRKGRLRASVLMQIVFQFAVHAIMRLKGEQ